MNEKRFFERIPVNIPAIIYNDNDIEEECKIVNISEDGFGIIYDKQHNLKQSDIIRLYFYDVITFKNESYALVVRCRISHITNNIIGCNVLNNLEYEYYVQQKKVDRFLISRKYTITKKDQ